MFSQDEYRGKFCPSMVMDCISADATALINYTWWAASYPPMVLLRYNRRSSIPIRAPQCGLALQYFIQRSILLFCRSSTSRMGPPQSPPRPRSGVPLLHSRLYTSLRFGDAQRRWAAPLDRRSLAWICSPQIHSALLYHHHHSSCPPYTPHQALLLSWWRTSFPHKFIILPFKLHFDSPRANLPIPTLYISQIELNNIGTQFSPLARPESFGNTRSASSFFEPLMNCVFLHLSALMRWVI